MSHFLVIFIIVIIVYTRSDYSQENEHNFKKYMEHIN